MSNFDESFYMNTLLPGAHEYLANNERRYGTEFCHLFMNDHKSNRDLAVRFSDAVANQAYRANGQVALRSDAQLFEFISNYIEEIASVHFNNQNRAHGGGFQGGFSRGGFGQTSGFQNSGFGRSTGGMANSGFGMSTRNMASQGVRDDSITTQATVAPTTPQPAAAEPQRSAPVSMSFSMTEEYSRNPLDDMEDDTRFNIQDEGKHWGHTPAKDNRLVITKKEALKTGDHKYVIHRCEGFARIYSNDLMEVVKLFFATAPEEFLAEHFIFKLFYNHVEEINVATDTFVDIQSGFLRSLDREDIAYKSIIDVVNTMPYGPRMAVANYLVGHINRALYKNFGMAIRPSTRIQIAQIEDLEELLGTSFSHPIMEVPDARDRLIAIVNNAIKSALSGYSSAMFTGGNDQEMIDIIRTSSVFPTTLDGVYPKKSLIPSSQDSDFGSFKRALEDNVLSGKTYVRSIREVIITNIFGERQLSVIGDKPTKVDGQIANMVASLKAYQSGTMTLGRNECERFDEMFQTDTRIEEYEQFLKDPRKYVSQDVSRFSEIDMPTHPVDMTVFAIQFKKSPFDYIRAIDVVTSIDSRNDKNSGTFAFCHIPVIHPK